MKIKVAKTVMELTKTLMRIQSVAKVNASYNKKVQSIVPQTDA